MPSGGIRQILLTGSMVAENNAKATGGVTGKGFKPGQSGNPGGRPKKLAKLVRDSISGEDLIDFQIAVLTLDGERLERWQIRPHDVKLRDRQQAHNWLTERGHGKAAPLPTVEDGDPLELAAADREIAGLEDELARLREAKARGIAQGTAVAGAGTNGSGPA